MEKCKLNVLGSKIIFGNTVAIMKILAIFIISFSLYANKSVIGFYKDGKKIENTVAEKKQPDNEAKDSSILQRNIRDNIINFARSKLGSKYVWGAAGSNTFDCSGFVQYVFRKSAGISIPRVSSDQANYKPSISLVCMEKGDFGNK